MSVITFPQAVPASREEILRHQAARRATVPAIPVEAVQAGGVIQFRPVVRCGRDLRRSRNDVPPRAA